MEQKTDCSKDLSEQDLTQSSLMKERFRRLHTQAVWMGLSPSDFEKLKSLQDIHRNNRSIKAIILYCLIILITFLLTIKHVNEVLGYPIDVAALATINGDFNDDSARCLLWNTPNIDTVFSPPVHSCDYCRNTTTIEKTEDLDVVTFYTNFSYPQIPVVVSKGAQPWPALNTFNFAFLKSLYSRINEATLKSTECDFFPFHSKFTDPRTVFDMTEEQIMEYGPWYIGWQECDWYAHTELEKHLGTPNFLRQVQELNLWIFMGTPGHEAIMQVDNSHRPTWQAQITGSEEWILTPASDCYFECATYDLKVTLEPGDILVVDPSVWKRTVRNVRDEMSISVHGEFE